MSLQNQLGLALAQAQTANMNAQAYNATNPGRVQISGVGVGGQSALPTNSTISQPVSSTQSVSPTSGIASRSFSASTPVSAPVSVTNSTIDTPTGIQSKKNKNIAESATQSSLTPLAAPVEAPPTQPLPDMSGFREATAGQDVQFRQSYRKALETPIETISPVTTETGLTGAELQAYNMLTPQEQDQYKALATQGLKAQTDYLMKSKANMEYEQSQEDKRLEMEDNNDEIAYIQSQRQIEEAQRQVANLKQNIGYLGTGGQPGASSAKLDAVSNQITLADRTLKNIIEAERLSAVNRQLGQEKNAEIFSRQMKILQDDLDGKVNKTVQSALNEFTSAELAGKLDTIPEIEAFQQQLYAQLDYDLSSIMDTNIEARKFLIERYDKLAESQKTAMANAEKAKAEEAKRKNTLNKEMSQALGYYVNENGEPLTDRVTGGNIMVPPESDVTYDKDSGQMVILTKNRDGTVGVQIKQVSAGTPQAPKTVTVDNPDGTKSTLQWTGTEWSPIQVPTQAPGSYYGGFRVTQDYGAADTPNSKDVVLLANGQKGTPGIDFAMPENTPVMSTVSGKVTYAGGRGEYGNQVVVTDEKGNQHMFSHLNNSSLTIGDTVQAGQQIGLSGNTGFSTGAHLDYRVKSSRGWEDPKNFLGGKQESGMVGSSGAPMAFEKQIWNRIPAQMKNSDTERAQILKDIKSMYDSGISTRDAVLMNTGFDVSKIKEGDKPMIEYFIGVGNRIPEGLPEDYFSKLALYSESGDIKSAEKYVNGVVDGVVKKANGDNAILTPVQTSMTRNIDQIVGLIEKNKDKLGAVDGRYTELVKKFGKEQDIQKLQTLMTATFADLRKNFAGSAVTSTELEALKDFVAGSINEVPENLITKLQTLKEMQTNEYNDQRAMYGIQDVSKIKLQSEAKNATGANGFQDFMTQLSNLINQ